MWRIDDPQCNEALKVKYDIVPYTRGRGLDIGCGQFKAYPHFIGVDNGHHWGTGGVDVVSNADDLSAFASNSMDFVFSSHTLEHMDDPLGTLQEWWRVIKGYGYLVLYLPHKGLYPNIGQRGANPDHKHDFLPEDVVELMKQATHVGWDLVVNEVRDNDNGPGQMGNEYSFLQIYKKYMGGKYKQPLYNFSCDAPKPEKTAAVVRYGGFGDMIQSSSVLPGLKASGYHVTMFTTPRGHMVMEHDPHIDAFVIQDNDQVPNAELGPYWNVQHRKYDLWINLCESVEASLLTLPGRIGHQYPQEVRRKLFNVNYLERTHDIAGLPFEFAARFYPTDNERKWARDTRKSFTGPVMMYSLSGSSVHKCWPYMDTLIARLLIRYPDLHIVTVGGPDDKILESGWENEDRVVKVCGEWSIRQTLTFIEECDLVFGPETGILNAAGLLDVPKVVLLSHSSEENLTKHWMNCTSIAPSTSCHPCHMMHYNFDHCIRDEKTGVAQCQADIDVSTVYQAMIDVMEKRRAA